MTFKALFNYFKVCVTTKYCCFTGRARRAEFWSFVLFNEIFSFLFSLLSFTFLSMEAAQVDYAQMNPWAQLGSAIASNGFSMLFFLVMLLPSVGVTVRRLHDTGRSGLWCLLPIVPAMVCLTSVFFIIFGQLLWLFFTSLLLWLVSGIALLVFFCLDSQPGENSYGPNPKDEELAGIPSDDVQSFGGDYPSRY